MQYLIFKFICNDVIHRNKAANKDASYLFTSMHTKQYAVKAKKPSERHLLRSLTAAGKSVFILGFLSSIFLSLFLLFS